MKQLTITFIVLFSMLFGCENKDGNNNLSSKSITVNIYQLVDNDNTVAAKADLKKVGIVNFIDSQYGLLINTDLSDLEPGLHGFHIHSNSACGSEVKDGKLVLGLAAGGHLDPQNTNKHLGPYSDEGHLGDLPVLFVTNDRKANAVLLAPRLKLSDLTGRSVLIHAGGDNYNDHPHPLGGGGARVYCGIV